MTDIFLFSEDTAVAMQLLTAALELKRSLDQPIVALALTEASARDLAAGGADTVLLLQGAGDWVEELGEAIHGLVKARGGSVLLVGATLRGKQVADWVAARLSGPVLSPAGRHGAIRLCRLPGVRCLPHPVQRRRRDTLELSGASFGVSYRYG
jgi:electron transfer flavoprotein alpha subunit